MTLEFTVPVKPVPKSRGSYPTTKTLNYQRAVRLYARQAHARVRAAWPSDVNYKLVLEIYADKVRVRVEALPKRTRAVRGDIKNIGAAVEDGINDSGIWRDDCRVVEWDVRDMGAVP